VTEDEVLGAIAAAVATVLEVEPATVVRELRFVEDLQADSLALVEIVEVLELDLAARHHGFFIEDEVLDDLRTVGDALDYALARLT
jgi:acyl carrier protein